MRDAKTPEQIFDLMRRHFVGSIPHIGDIGMQVTALSELGARVELPYRPDWLGDTQRGVIHTGIITTLVDSACGLAVVAAQKYPAPVATLDLRMDYLRAAVPDKTLHCHAECYRLTRSIAFVRAHVWQDLESEPVAVSQSTFMLSAKSSKAKPP